MNPFAVNHYAPPMGTSAEERGIIREILDLAERGTTHLLPDVMENPVSKYTDPGQLRREIDVLFREFPLILGHTSDVAEPGDFMTHDETGG